MGVGMGRWGSQTEGGVKKGLNSGQCCGSSVEMYKHTKFLEVAAERLCERGISSSGHSCEVGTAVPLLSRVQTRRPRKDH